jgi:DNA helicase-2/ATP-dependent DNA helicase PcrA
MRFVADLHIHSHLSRATSKDLNLENLHRVAQLKGIRVVGTGDFTHPRWFAELREKLVPAEGGLFALRPDLARAVDAAVPAACRAPVRFMLSVEVSSIYKRADQVRKVHNLIYAPDLEAAATIATRLANIGNIESDGRPILGLDSRDLLEIVLESSPNAYLVPAHIWTPWFSALGAQSGFDALSDCFADLAPHVFAAETGLSSDPAMNWRVSELDRLALVSNSDAHSPDKLGREANLFDCDLSYFGIRDALASAREGFLGTIEFFPEEGKYHFDGHRACGVVLEPAAAKARDGLCPRCTKKLTGGVAGRVEALADRPEGFRPEGAKPFQSMVPLAEIVGELVETGPASARVRRACERLLDRVGSELALLTEVPLETLAQEGPPLFAEALRRVRSGEVKVQPGFDGVYGTVQVFDPEERRKLLAQRTFGFAGALCPKPAAPEAEEPVPAPEPEVRRAAAPASGLDPDQERAAAHGDGPLVIVAGPGTGKTRTLVHRIARLRRAGVSPRAITAVTFTRRAAEELRERLAALGGDAAAQVGAATFHGLGLELLRAFPEEAGLPAAFTVLDDDARLAQVEAALAGDRALGSPAAVAEEISRAKADLRDPAACEPALAAALRAYEAALAAAGAVDFDDLVVRPIRLLGASEPARAWVAERCRHLLVDEYQDVNAAQYRLVQLLAQEGPETSLCVVGDPDQAIYGFRGSDPSYFGRFTADHPGASSVTLTRNYRSTPAVVGAATHVVARSPGRPPRALLPMASGGRQVERWLAGSQAEEAELIAAEIERAVGGTSLEGIHAGRTGGGEALALHDIAVLVRTAAQLEVLEEALQRAGIPCHPRGDAAVAGRRGMSEVLALLRAAVEAGGVASGRGAGAPGPAGAGTPEAGAEAPSVADRIAQLAVGDDLRRRRASELLATLAVPFGRDAAGFLAALPTLHESDARLERQKVSLLTLHASKGLEFPLVFIAGCEDGLLPLRFPGDEGRSDVEEERRLLYVGMTRAQQRLVLTAARRRTLFGRAQENGPSPFLEDLPPTWVAAPVEPPRKPRTQQLSLL